MALEQLEARSLLTGTWTPLAHAAPSSTGTMMLLSDGTVMAQGGGVSNTWYRLTPDAAGSYASGTWAQLASMSLQRLYFGSNVLQDGRLLVVGGEYSGPTGAQNFTNTGEIYDPVTNTWSGIPNFPQSRFGDDPTELLPDGRVLAGYLSGPQTYIYDPGSNNWSFAANKLRNDRSDEETWLKLPDDSILSYDVFSPGPPFHAQRYLPSQDRWVDAGTVPVPLSSSAVGSELGPAFLLPDGRAFFLGATGHTAFYTPSTNTWTAGPDIPNGLGADDAPGAMMPNGKILLAADRPLFNGPTRIFEFDPTTNTYTDVTPASSILDTSGPSYVERMLVLPTGQVLVTSGSSQLAVYTPDGSPDPSWGPTISAVTTGGDGSFTLTGTQLNGISEGASYGDDAEMSSNYPLVRLTDAAGNVTYARTFRWSSTGVATGDTPVSTQFQLPRGLNPGRLYALSVVANGIASDPVPFVVGPGGPYVTSFLPSGSILPTAQANRPINVDFNTAATDFTSNFAVSNNGGANNTSLTWGAGAGVQDQPGPAPGGGVQSRGGVAIDSTAVYTPATVNLSDGLVHTMSEYVTAVAGLGAGDKPLQIGFLAPPSTGFNAGFSFISARILGNTTVEFQYANGGAATSIADTTPTGTINAGDWLQLIFTTQETAPGSFRGSFSLIDYGPTGVGAGTTVLAPVSYTVSGLSNLGTASAVSPGFRIQTPAGFSGQVRFDNFAVDPQAQAPALYVTFDRPIDASTFTTASIDSFTGPGGADLRGRVTSVDVVPGSGGRQFAISLAQPLTTTGSYTITLGPNIDDTDGHPMDQNGNYIPGEVPGDEFTTSFSVLGPRIIASTPTGATGAPVGDLFVTFNEPMDPRTFDPSDVVLIGPNGPITVTDVTPVAGSNNTRFDLRFGAQTAVGSYRAVIGPDIRDPFGNEMDQDNNGIPGEVPGDQFTSTFTIIGPRIISSTPTGATGPPVTDITVTFNEPMDPSTFDPTDVVLTGPNGPITVTDVTPVAGSNNTRFDLRFGAQTAVGSYRAVIGPDIRDPFGNEMDQDNNGTPGEIPGDQFVVNFSVIRVVNYQAQAVPQNFIQLAGDPGAFTIITTADDSSVPVNLGSNTFSFYNGVYTDNNQLYVSSNGLITFGSSNTSFSNSDLTTSPTQAAIAPLWSDWIGSNVNDASDPMVLGKFTTFNGAPALILEWNQVWHFPSSPRTITFEAILRLNTGSAQGDIYFEYANLDTGDTNRNGATATVGIKESGTQPTTGGNRLLINLNNGNNPLVQSGTALHLSAASPGPDVEAQFEDPFAAPGADAALSVLPDGNRVDDGKRGGNGGDVGGSVPLTGPAVVGATSAPGGWDRGATPADAARGTPIDLAIADGDPDVPRLPLAGLTQLGRRRGTWPTSSA